MRDRGMRLRGGGRGTLLWGLRQPCLELPDRGGGNLGGLGGKGGLTGEGKSDAHFI